MLPDSLEHILVGPIVRHTSATQLALWCVTSRADALMIEVRCKDSGLLIDSSLDVTQIRVGTHAYIQWLNIRFDKALNAGQTVSYQILCKHSRALVESGLCLDGENLPQVRFQPKLTSVFHGSCRKPHHDSADGFCAADEHLKQGEPPSLLMLSGDQVYVDDVAGPMVLAIADVIEGLGLWGETFEGAAVADSQSLMDSPLFLYRRTELLPDVEENERLQSKLFGGVRKPIFTSASADNHLITLAEVLAMYFLVWSPVLWRHIDLKAMPARLNTPQYQDLPEEKRDTFKRQLVVIEGFVAELPRVARVMAHVPTYMMFDDHDVTDDWNLTRAWEEVAYGNRFSKRILGNALLGYMVCQGWGNQPDKTLADFGAQLQALVDEASKAQRYSRTLLNAMLDRVFEYESWHFTLDTQPKMLVLDTRTHRWRSESRAHKPSGLMDWEALSDMQQSIIGEDSVVLVSPAPMFGVKLIESIQAVFTFFGKALTVDAENWMAHRGAANVLLNILRHPKTPRKFTILSGDVHYSFVYDVGIRFRKGGPKVWQITQSGIKNEFPAQLLAVFDQLNQWLYGRYSPLNFLTKRRRMEVSPRTPSGVSAKLYNHSGMGYVCFTEQGEPQDIAMLTAERTGLLDVNKGELGGFEYRYQKVVFNESSDIQV